MSPIVCCVCELFVNCLQFENEDLLNGLKFVSELFMIILKVGATSFFMGCDLRARHNECVCFNCVRHVD